MKINTSNVFDVRGYAHLLSETVTTMESIPRKVVRFDSSKVRARVVRRSSTSPMIRMGCMDELNCEVTDTTGVVVETEMLTIAVESLDVLIDRARATHGHAYTHQRTRSGRLFAGGGAVI